MHLNPKGVEASPSAFDAAGTEKLQRKYPRVDCPDCGRSITRQNISAHRRTMHGLIGRVTRSGRWRDDPQGYIRSRVAVDPASGCWLWQLTIDSGGYGHGNIGPLPVGSHRMAYEAFVGPIPDGLTIDHVCHTNAVESCVGGDACLHRRCCNPDHLEAVTMRENLQRSPNTMPSINAAATHCRAGHPYTVENTRRDEHGWRACRTCARLQARRRRDNLRMRIAARKIP